jgi:polyhydroxybutyrate depolymerase
MHPLIHENSSMMTLAIKSLRTLMIVLCCIHLLACGGGGGGSDDNTISNSTTPASSLPTGLSGDYTKTVSVDGVTRTYILHVPASYQATQPSAAVLLLHGGGGSASTIGAATSNTGGGFNAFADLKGFIAIYPDSVSGNWDDGRETITQRTNDVAFINALLDAVAKDYSLDTKRVFASGISNGGMMTQRLACELPGRLAAIAAVAANMPSALTAGCNPTQPVPVALFSGDADPLMPFSGGMVVGNIGGSVLSATDTAAFWANKQAAALSQTTALPNTDLTDGTTTDLFSYTGAGNAEVAFYRINGGGHTWPGGTQYASQLLIGKVSKDFSANEAMWSFFLRHAKP